MSYVSGFLLAAPTANRAACKKMTEDAWEIFKDCGCLNVRENWGVDVPDGKVSSFPLAVKKKDNETVVFSWMEWPDKEICDKGWEAAMKDPRMEKLPEMPFDGMRMMWGGFEPLVSLNADG